MTARAKTKKQTSKTPLPTKQPNKTVAPFADHFAEFRRRLTYVGVVLLAGASLAYVFREQLLAVIMAPLQGEELIYLTPGGGFSFIFQVALYAGLLVAAPVLVYNFHAFIRPALPERAQKSLGKITILASILITAGACYGYFVAVPAAMHFLNNFADEFVTSSLTASSYLSFFVAYTAGLALISLIPLVLIFWHWISPLTPGGTLRSEQAVIVVAFILAAIITPTPDVYNQIMVAAPIIAVYQIGIISVLISIARQRRLEKRTQLERAMIESKSMDSIKPQIQAMPAAKAQASPLASSVPPAQPAPTGSVHKKQSPRPRMLVDSFRSSPSVLQGHVLSQQQRQVKYRQSVAPLSKQSAEKSRNHQLAPQRPRPVTPPRVRLSVDGLVRN